MNETDRKALEEVGRDLHDWLSALLLEDKLKHLKKIGILDLAT